MSTVVCPLHWHHDPERLEDVVARMRLLGPPVLRGHWDPASGAFFMREGTHRLRAALRLGLAPVIRLIPWWRSPAALERAQYSAILHGHVFDRVEVEP